MVNKAIEIHPQAPEELKLATKWYLERSPTAASNFVRELDRAINLIFESPARWPRLKMALVIHSTPFPFCARVQGESDGGSNPRICPWAQTTGILENPA